MRTWTGQRKEYEPHCVLCAGFAVEVLLITAFDSCALSSSMSTETSFISVWTCCNPPCGVFRIFLVRMYLDASGSVSDTEQFMELQQQLVIANLGP